MRKEDAHALINEITKTIVDKNIRLVGFELNFYESIKMRLRERGPVTLSQKQGDILQKIYRKVQGG
jgi:hypothetical protein